MRPGWAGSAGADQLAVRDHGRVVETLICTDVVGAAGRHAHLASAADVALGPTLVGSGSVAIDGIDDRSELSVRFGTVSPCLTAVGATHFA
jgi:hypothetical protein